MVIIAIIVGLLIWIFVMLLAALIGVFPRTFLGAPALAALLVLVPQDCALRMYLSPLRRRFLDCRVHSVTKLPCTLGRLRTASSCVGMDSDSPPSLFRRHVCDVRDEGHSMLWRVSERFTAVNNSGAASGKRHHCSGYFRRVHMGYGERGVRGALLQGLHRPLRPVPYRRHSGLCGGAVLHFWCVCYVRSTYVRMCVI